MAEVWPLGGLLMTNLELKLAETHTQIISILKPLPEALILTFHHNDKTSVTTLTCKKLDNVKEQDNISPGAQIRSGLSDLTYTFPS